MSTTREPHPMRGKLEDTLRGLKRQEDKIADEVSQFEDELRDKNRDLDRVRSEIRDVERDLHHMRVIDPRGCDGEY